MTLEMGECVECGHHQPGEIKSSEAVSPLADECAKCDSQSFVVSDENDQNRFSISQSPFQATLSD